MCQGITYSFDGKDVFNIVISIINHSSMDWFQRNFTGNNCFWCERLEERNAFLIFSTFLSSPLTLGVGLGWGGVGWGGCDNVMYVGGNTYGVDSGVASMRATFSRAWVSSAKTNGMESRKTVLKFKRFPTGSANTWENTMNSDESTHF